MSQISAGYGTFCGISSQGGLYCWGQNILAPEQSSLEPTLIAQGQWSQVGATGNRICALNANDKYIYCYGKAYNGELGNGIDGETEESTLTPIAGSTEFESLSVGYGHACGISTEGDLYCWGSNEKGQLGTGNTLSSSTPVSVASDNGPWTQVSVGETHTCAINDAEEGWCWGDNEFNQVIVSDNDVEINPTLVEGEWKSISAGNGFTLGIETDGTGYGWGLDEKIDEDFAMGALLGSGEEQCYGFESNESCDEAEYGYYTYDSDQTPIEGDKTWLSISAGSVPCAIEEGTNALYCWGYSSGEAYSEGSPQSLGPIIPAGTEGTSWASISSSPEGARCGIQTDGSVWCWGRNEFNCDPDCTLGDGTSANSAEPVRVLNIDSSVPGEQTPVSELVPDTVPQTESGNPQSVPSPSRETPAPPGEILEDTKPPGNVPEGTETQTKPSSSEGSKDSAQAPAASAPSGTLMTSVSVIMSSMYVYIVVSSM